MAKIECITCGALVHPDDANYLQIAADDEAGPFCKTCYERENPQPELDPRVDLNAKPFSIADVLPKHEPAKRMMRAYFTGFNLTASKDYEIKFEYDTVYEVVCDDGTYCRPKGFFYESPAELDDYCQWCDLKDCKLTVHSSGCEGSRCTEAREAYEDNLHDETVQEYMDSVKEADKKNERVDKKEDTTP